MDTAIGAVVWYLFGYAFAFGDTEGDYVGNGFIGNHYFAVSGLTSSTTPYDFRHWIFQWAFAITSSTIVSGAMAERTRLRAYFVFCVALAFWIYPVPTHWVWSKDGWLSPTRTIGPLYANGFLDFAGDSVVHMIGGASSFIGAWIVGPRLGRFDPELKGHFDPHNQSFMMLGTMILWFGWYGFNPGSTQALANGQGLVAARIAINTTLAASTGTIGGLLCAKLFLKQWHLPTALNGCLVGLVAITGPCAFVQPWAAVIIGFTAAFVYYWSSWLMVNKLKIDDPLEATNVHFFGGIWGLLMVGLFCYPDSIEKAYGRPAGSVTDYGLFVGGGGKQLAMQLVGILTIGLWALFWAGLVWFIMKKFKFIRISEAAEKDLLSHAVELERIQKGTRALRAVAVGGAEGTEVRQMAPKSFNGASREVGKETVVVIHESSSSDDENPTMAAKMTAKTAAAPVAYISDSSSSSSTKSDGARRRFTTEGRKESAREMMEQQQQKQKVKESTSSDDDSEDSEPKAKRSAKKSPGTKKRTTGSGSAGKKSGGSRSKKSSSSRSKDSSSAKAPQTSARNIVHIPDSTDDDTTSE